MQTDFANQTPMPIVDCHVHFSGLDGLERISEVCDLLDREGVGRFNVVSTPHPHMVNFNPPGIYAKARYPARIFFFGGLDYTPVTRKTPAEAAADLAKQVDRVAAIGGDGLKMIEGKPTTRKWLPFPFDGPLYRDLFSRLEETGFPLLFHVNDPEEFWDAALASPLAKERGWFYGDGTYPAKEALYTEVGNVLQRCPKLKVIFAHFYFLSADLGRAGALLDRYENVHLDITPGSEMYRNFSCYPQATRDFFIKYQDRILYGTDTSDRVFHGAGKAELAERMSPILERFWKMRAFLETDQAVPGWGAAEGSQIQGIALPRQVVEKIYYRNFERIVGAAPRALNKGAAIAECERLAALFGQGGGMVADAARLLPLPPRNLAQEVAEFLASQANVAPA